MEQRDRALSTEQKALAVNLDERSYGSIVEIGAGQEVARRFFQVGAAAGTVAKTMSAYDMSVSDDIYGPVDRYVSRARLKQMLEREFAQVVNRLSTRRAPSTQFFAYAATVTARSFRQQNECHGWIGLRLQHAPGAGPSDIVLHVRMLDHDNAQQSEALGILGVNLVHGAFFNTARPDWIVEGLADNLGSERIEVDLIHFSGPGFAGVENRLMNLHLIRSWLTRAVIFDPTGEVVVPAELFYRKPVMVMRGSFKPVTRVNVDMMGAGLAQFAEVSEVDATKTVALAEVTMNSLVSGDDVDAADFLARVDLLAACGYTVMISDYVRFFRLRAYLRRYTSEAIGIVLSVRDFSRLFDENYYEGLEGGMLEAFGKLFPDHTHVYVYPSRPTGSDALITLDNVEVPGHLRHLLAHLVENGKLVAIKRYEDRLLHIDSASVLAAITHGPGTWEDEVPDAVAERIVAERLLGFPA
jgi:hypothetical protein